MNSATFEIAVRGALQSTAKGLFHETRLGWLTHQNDNFLLGPAFLTSFNYARLPFERSYIQQFSRNSPVESIESLYSLCNGMKILGDRFMVPGVGFHQPNMSDLEFFNVPYDFQVCGGLDSPAHSPVDGLIVGKSRQNNNERHDTLFDIIDETGRVVSGYFESSPEVIEMESDYTRWIGRRVSQAEESYVQALRNKLN